MRIARIVNTMPNDHSNEINSDSEPNIAVNPNNPHEMMITAFTPPDSGLTNGPVYVSTDGGENWSLRFEVPGNGSVDQTISFASASNELYMATLRADDRKLNVDRSADPSSGSLFSILGNATGSNVDQPWVQAISATSGPDTGKDRIYVGYNDTSVTKGATIDVCLDGLAGTPSFGQVKLDTRSALRDGFHIRPKANRDGTVYAGYQRWRSQSGSNTTMDMVVVRDDNWGSNNFADLTDPSDGKVGRIVAAGVVINEDMAGHTLGGQRPDNGFDVQVDPNNSDIVYLCWIDDSGPGFTLRVRRSLNRGVDWSADLITVDNAALATMAINTRGTVALAYLQLVSGQWETHFRTTSDGTNWDDLLLARTATAGFIGDYMRMEAVYHDFYGVFPAMNTPNPANFFPNGGGTLRFQRTTSGNQLRGTDGTTVISPSVDPFFFKVQERDCVVITDRSTFGKDEIDAMLHLTSPAVISTAFYVTVDGFPANELGITAATFSGTPNVVPTITFNPPLNGMTVQATACSAPDESNLNVPQRFTWTYAVIFSNDSDFTGENVPVTMTASITSTTQPNITVTGQAVITLTTQPNPYEIDGPTSWLSVDLQVFQVLEGGSLPNTPGTALTAAGPNDFISRLLSNTGGGYNDPTLPRAPNHPFDLDLVANQNTSAVSIAGRVGLTPVYNFAVARVRYRALSTPASNVRVFFRLFQISTTSTDFQPSSTYLTGGQGGTKIPLLGVVNGEVVTIPCFAAPRVDPTNPQGLNAQTDPVNVGPVGGVIPPDSTGAEVQVYFGCWLDINQNVPVLPASPASAAGPFTPTRSIQQTIRGQHQCLVAEVNLDPPEPQIAVGATPATSDKLAQRNLNIVGVASPHQVPHTFDIRPTATTLPSDQAPDELMIDWGNLPAGSQASIYLPDISADTILEMADELYTLHGLSRSDAHTLTCEASGITYVPIPPGIGSNYAGLMTIDLPATVTQGQSFTVITRQITNAFGSPPVIIEAPARREAAENVIEWRGVVGTFQISVPVETKEALLGTEERLLSVLRWIQRTVPSQDRWHPVFERYVDQIAGRVEGFGGDPNSIFPSPTGTGAAVFVHRVTAENISDIFPCTTYVDHPLTNGNPDAILFVTHNWNPLGMPSGQGQFNNHPIGVWYDEGRQQWAIYNEDEEDMVEDVAFDVSVCSQPFP